MDQRPDRLSSIEMTAFAAKIIDPLKEGVEHADRDHGDRSAD